MNDRASLDVVEESTLAHFHLSFKLFFVLIQIEFVTFYLHVSIFKKREHKVYNKTVHICLKLHLQLILTSLSLTANITAPACSAAFPTTGRRITLRNATGILNSFDAP